ncbi:hypothetical protein [Aquimarina agarilytica]|uniref:hypothetical protein n=1 Tax=Aquimarina agarilytica TaxID=1087449 RepID=UPI0002884024|nr:hypothetical protein [Aquimarina agarilytica]
MYNIEYIKKMVTSLEWLDTNSEKETPEFYLVKGMIANLPFLDRIKLLGSILGMPEDNDLLSLPFTPGHFNLFFDLEYCRIHPHTNELLIYDKLMLDEANYNYSQGDDSALEAFNWLHQPENIDHLEINNYHVRIQQKIVSKIYLTGNNFNNGETDPDSILEILYGITTGLQYRKFLLKKYKEPIVNHSSKYMHPTIANDFLTLENKKITNKSLLDLTESTIWELLTQLQSNEDLKSNQDYLTQIINIDTSTISKQNLSKFIKRFFEEYCTLLPINSNDFFDFLFVKQSFNHERLDLNRDQLEKIMEMFLFLSEKNALKKSKKIQIIRNLHSYFNTKLSIPMLKKIYNKSTTHPKKNTLLNYSMSWKELSI